MRLAVAIAATAQRGGAAADDDGDRNTPSASAGGDAYVMRNILECELVASFRDAAVFDVSVLTAIAPHLRCSLCASFCDLVW